MSRVVRCDHCQEVVDRPRLRWSASLPSRNGQPGESFDFCTDECFADFLDDRMEQRAARKAAREAVASSVATPLSMPSKAVAAP